MAKFIGYLPVGFPTYTKSIEGYKALIDAGVDIIEIGVPYSDPVMDGLTIQNATKTAIENGFVISDIFRAIEEIKIYSNRQFEVGNSSRKVEIYVMCYYNQAFHYGLERFAGDLKDAGATGTIIPDLIPDEAQKWVSISKRNMLKNVFLVAPNTNPERMDLITTSSSGFIYTSSLLGVTGTRDNDDYLANANYLIQKVRDSLLKVSRDTPVYLGIGINSATAAAKVASFADGVIVGSLLVKALEKSKEDLFTVASNLANVIRSGQKPDIDISSIYR